MGTPQTELSRYCFAKYRKAARGCPCLPDPGSDITARLVARMLPRPFPSGKRSRVESLPEGNKSASLLDSAQDCPNPSSDGVFALASSAGARRIRARAFPRWFPSHLPAVGFHAGPRLAPPLAAPRPDHQYPGPLSCGAAARRGREIQRNEQLFPAPARRQRLAHLCGGARSVAAGAPIGGGRRVLGAAGGPLAIR